MVDKELLIASSSQKYALAEANIMKRVQHPFVLNIYFAF